MHRAVMAVQIQAGVLGVMGPGAGTGQGGAWGGYLRETMWEVSLSNGGRDFRRLPGFVAPVLGFPAVAPFQGGAVLRAHST